MERPSRTRLSTTTMAGSAIASRSDVEVTRCMPRSPHSKDRQPETDCQSMPTRWYHFIMACLVHEYNVTTETQRNHPLHACGLRAIHSTAPYFSIYAGLSATTLPSVLCTTHV